MAGWNIQVEHDPERDEEGGVAGPYDVDCAALVTLADPSVTKRCTTHGDFKRAAEGRVEDCI